MWVQKGRWLRRTAALAGAALALFLLWLCLGWLLPQRLTLLAGQCLELKTKLPVSAKTEESIGVLGITTKPLADPFHLELGTAITAEPKKTGSTEVTFYLCNALPLKTVRADVLAQRELVPVGKTVGVTMDMKGLLVLGTGYVSGEDAQSCAPCDGILEIGDLILEADGRSLENKEAFMEVIEKSGGKPIALLLERDGKTQTVQITPAFSAADEGYKIGAWIRDSIQGIGTVTYYDPLDGSFGALGHGVYDVDTGELSEIREGSLVSSTLTEIIAGKKGTPGELSGEIDLQQKLGRIEKNTEVGIYGRLDTDAFAAEALPIATLDEIEKGAAVLLSDLEGGAVEAYAIEIESVKRERGKNHKDMTIRITDERLLERTGGIVQGMGVIDNRDNTKKPGNTGFFSSYPKNDPTIGV